MWSTSSPSVVGSPTIVASVFLRRRLLGEIVRARLRDSAFYSVDELAAEPSSWNNDTKPDSSARYRYWDNKVDLQEGGRVCFNVAIWGDDEVARCLQIRQKAVAAGVPNVDAYAQAEPVASQMAAGQYDGSWQRLMPHGGDPGTSLRWTYIERHVLPRWKAVRAVWNAAPRSRRRALERNPAAEAQATDQGTLGNGCYGMTSCQHSCVRQHLWPLSAGLRRPSAQEWAAETTNDRRALRRRVTLLFGDYHGCP